jgi:phage tail sheath protein FI
MSNAPGVEVTRIRAGNTAIRGAETSVAAFFGPTLKGPSYAFAVTSIDQFERIFGGPYSESYMYEAVRGFFQNGGRRCYIGRVFASSGNAAATVDLLTASSDATSGSLSSNTGVFPVALAAGDTFTGKVDGGGANTFTIQATAATKTLTGGTYAAGAGGDSITFSVVVMGVTLVQTVDLSAVAGTQQAYIDALNAVVGIKAVAAGADIVLTTDQKGSGAAASITAVGGTANVKLYTGAVPSAFTNAGPNNVANLSQVTAAEFVTLAEATYAGSTTVDNGDGSVTWTSDTSGVSSSVQFSAGTGVSKITGFDNAVHSGAATGPGVTTITVDASFNGDEGNNLSCKVSKTETKIGALEAALTTADTYAMVTSATAKRITKGDQLRFENSGGTVIARAVVASLNGNKVTFTGAVTFSGGPLAFSGSKVFNETFSLSVYEDAKLVYGPLNDLRMSSLSARNYYVTRINGDGTDPEVPITVTDGAVAATSTTDPRPVNASAAAVGDPLTGGTLNTTITDANYVTAFALVDKIKGIRLASTAGATGINTTGAISKALIDYCANRGDMVAIVEAPSGTSVSNAITHKNSYLTGSQFGSLFYPWLRIIDPLSGMSVSCPPSGHVCGALARTHTNRSVAKAAAGPVDGQLFGAIGLEGLAAGTNLVDADVSSLTDENINTVQVDNGVVVMGDRTLEAGEFNWLHVVLTFIFFEQSLKVGTKDMLFEPPGPATQASLKRAIESFCYNEWNKPPSKQTLVGETFADAMQLVCDETNNPPSEGRAGRTNATVYLNIPDTTERVRIYIGRDNRALDAQLGV